MAQTKSAKYVLIDKTNARIVTFVSVAAFIVVFSLVATKTLASQAKYQNHIISEKRKTVNQLKTNITATDQLKTSYANFIATNPNILSGNRDGAKQGDGSNAKIILDALPSSYDFPGLTTSLEALLQSQNVTIASISGTDDEVTQSANQSSASPQSVPIPFQVAVTGDYTGMQNVINAFERSIRPIQIQSIDLSGTQGKLTMNITAQTYYQPAKSLSFKKETVQ